jgi:hypothetical protein
MFLLLVLVEAELEQTTQVDAVVVVVGRSLLRTVTSFPLERTQSLLAARVQAELAMLSAQRVELLLLWDLLL